MKRRMSQALAMRSTWMPMRVTHVRPRMGSAMPGAPKNNLTTSPEPRFEAGD